MCRDREARMRQFVKIDEWLVKFQASRPIVFELFCIGVAVVACAAGIAILNPILDLLKVQP